MALFVTSLWRGKNFPRHTPPVYGLEHVRVLASMLKRHGGHELMCVTSSEFHNEVSKICTSVLMPSEISEMDGFIPKLWLWSIPTKPCSFIDLDTVVLADPAPIVNRGDFAIWNDAIGELYNTSIVVNPHIYPEVWTEFSVEKLKALYKKIKSGHPYLKRFTGDQTWVSHILGPGMSTIGDSEGVYRYRPSRHLDRPPDNAVLMFGCGPFDFAVERDLSQWVKESYQ